MWDRRSRECESSRGMKKGERGKEGRGEGDHNQVGHHDDGHSPQVLVDLSPSSDDEQLRPVAKKRECEYAHTHTYTYTHTHSLTHMSSERLLE